MNLFMQDIIFVILAKPVVTLKLESMTMWKKTKKLIYIKYLHNNEECFTSFNSDWFSVSGCTPTQFLIKIKECMFID